MRTNGRNSKGKLLRTTSYIFTEGMTEKNYFSILNKKYNSSTNVNVILRDTGKQGISLIQHAIGRKKTLSKLEKSHLGAMYVIFDKDDMDNKELQESLKLASENEIKVGFSNSCFEVWLLAHFVRPNSSHKNNKLYTQLERYLGCTKYKKNHKNDMNLLRKLEDLVSTAISNTSFMAELNQTVINLEPYTNMAHVIQDVYSRNIY